MIDFATPAQKTRSLLQRHKAREMILDDAFAQEYKDGSDITDAARRLIASKPTMFFAFAFAVGGILGWLTSKR